MKELRWIPSALCVLTLLLITAPRVGQAAKQRKKRPRAAVTITETAEQPRKKVKALHTKVKSELEKRGVKVKRRAVPRRLVKRAKRLRAYTRRHRIKRVFDLRVKSRGKGYQVELEEKKGRRMRSAFSAKMAAGNIQEVDAVIPRLVEAVLRRKQPRVLVAEVQPTTIASDAAAPAATVTEQPAGPKAPSTPDDSRGEFLLGVSLEPGMFLTAAAGLYGGSGKLYYQKTPYRFGVEIQAMFGGGQLLNISARGQYLFPLASTPKITPLVGASLGYLMLTTYDDAEGNGIAFTASGGAQFSHLGWTDLVAELELVLPFFAATRHDPDLDNHGILNLVENSTYAPAVVLKLSALF